jgi:hypothetical protein
MITDEQIIEAMEAGQILENQYTRGNGMDFDVVREDGWIKIHAVNMYEYAPLTWKTLELLSKLFGTTEIYGPEEHDSTPGCESCDYGSMCEWWLRVKEPVD